MPRANLFVIVEGQTENAVLTKLLGPHLGNLGIDLHCPIVRLGAGRGGVKGLRCEDFCDQIHRFLKDKRQLIVSTFFDYYAFPHGIKSGWEFVAKAKAEVAFRGFAHGPRLAERLDLNTVRQACPRFSAWLTRLESFAPEAI
jgi:hypothetical protein